MADQQPVVDPDVEIDAIIRWLQEKWGDPKDCPFCGTSRWIVLRPSALSNLATVMCDNCGQTVFINITKIAHERPQAVKQHQSLDADAKPGGEPT